MRFLPPSGLVLAGAYLGLSVDEVMELAEERGLPLREVEYELYALERQGNIAVEHGRLTLPPTAPRLTRQIAERAAERLKCRGTITVFYKPPVRDEAETVAGEAEKLGFKARLVEDPERDPPLVIVTPYGVYRDPWQAISVLRHARG